METTVVGAWGEVLADLRKEVGETRYNLWFKNIVAVSGRDGVIEVGAPSAFMAEWLETHYHEMIARAASARLGNAVSVKFVVDGGLFRDQRRHEANAKEELLEEVAPAEPVRFETQRYNLDNFIVGPCNSIAYAAARKVVESPGTAYNPLFLHGGVGLGKTHLLVGIANALARKSRRDQTEYVSAEGFTNRFLFALRNGALDAFRARYRNAKLLVIDDVHFLANKPATQDEFLNTFNSLSGNGCQIVMASDSHPKLIGSLKESLVNRFVSGMVAKIEKPAYQTRLEIVRSKARDKGFAMSDDVADFVARHAQGSVREIEGAVNTLAAYASLSHSAVDIHIAAEALRGLVESGQRPVSLPDIEAVVAAFAGFSDGELRSQRRTQQISRARHLAMFLARQLGSYSYSEIGAYFGKRNHSSVVSAVEKVNRQISTDEELARAVSALRAEFGL